MNEKNNDHQHIYELLIRGSYQIRKILDIDDSCYEVRISSMQEPRKYYIHNVLNELDKAIFSGIFAVEALTKDENSSAAQVKDDQLSSKVIQVKIDELAMWRRKLVELLIDLIGFRSVNKPDYYRHYNILHELVKKKREHHDQKEFWGFTDIDLDQQIQTLKQNIGQIAVNLNAEKCWYLISDRKGPKTSDESHRFKIILKSAKRHQKAALITYRNSFGKPSELVHPKRVVDNDLSTIKDFEQAIRAVYVMGLHVVSAAKDLIHVHNVKGPIKQIADVIKKNAFPNMLFSLRTSPQIAVGDFVLIPNDNLAQVTKVTKTNYGYKTFHVKPMNSLGVVAHIEQYLPQNIRLLISRKALRKRTAQILEEVRPGVKVGLTGMDRALEKTMVEFLEDMKRKPSDVP